MNTHIFTLRQAARPRAGRTRTMPGGAGRISYTEVMRVTTRLAAAGLAAAALFVLGTWAALTAALAQYLSAGLWALGFVFFALAIESGNSRVYPLFLTGLAVPTLAVLGSRLAEGFTIAAVAIVAAWLAAWIAPRD